MKALSISQLRWANPEKTSVNAVVDFEGLGPVSFTADANDVTAHGRDIFNRANSGKLGAIASFMEQSPPPPAPRRYTWLEFMDLFTEPEQLAIVTASMQNAGIKLWYDKAMGASYIDLDDPRTIEGVNALATASLVTPQRAAEVLASQP
jgi:hypothetical protein